MFFTVDVLSPLGHALSPFTVSFSTGIALVIACACCGSHRVLRWPLLAIGLLHVAVEMAVVVLIVAAMGLWDIIVIKLRPTRSMSMLLSRMKNAKTWGEYHAAGRAIDNASAECDAWRKDPHHPEYNCAVVRRTLECLRAAREAGDADALLETLGTCVRTSFCGIDAEALYAHCHTGSKRLVELYVEEVVASLAEVQRRIGRDETYDEKVQSFLFRSQRVFGRTCLALSGGGGLANYSWGVARALFDQKLLPTLVCGTSAGAVVAAALCTHTDEELDAVLRPGFLVTRLTSFEEPVSMVLSRLLRKGHMYDAAAWAPKIQVRPRIMAAGSHALHTAAVVRQTHALHSSGHEARLAPAPLVLLPPDLLPIVITSCLTSSQSPA